MGIAAGDKKDTILGIDCQSGARAGFTGNIVMGSHGKRSCVKHRDIAFIFDIDIHVAVAVSDGLFRSSPQIDRANDRTIFCIDYSCVRHSVAEVVNTLVKRVEQNAVRVALHSDGLDDRKSF